MRKHEGINQNHAKRVKFIFKKIKLNKMHYKQNIIKVREKTYLKNNYVKNQNKKLVIKKFQLLNFPLNFLRL